MENRKNFSTSSNPLLSNLALVTGTTAIILKTIFYLTVTLLLEFGAWFLGGEVEKIERVLSWNKKQFLDHEIKKVYGNQASFILENNNPPALDVQSLESTYIIFINGEKKRETQGTSAGAIITEILGNIESKNLLEKYAGITVKVQNKNNKKDQQTHTINRPTLTAKNKNISTVPTFLKTSHSSLSVPVQERGTTEKNFSSKPNRAGAGTTGTAGTKRTGGTPDTGTQGENAHRYTAIKQAIGTGKMKGTIAGIKAFKVEGVGCGTSTAQAFRKKLLEEKII